MANAKAKLYKFHIGLAWCKACGDQLVSPRGGLFRTCGCGKSSIDQERFDGRYVRLIGEAEFIEQICPPTCKIKEHRKK